MTLTNLLDRGFDQSYECGGGWHVACSACEAKVVNGVACHEHRCPNAKHECRDCGALIPVRHRYCEECANG